MPYATCRMIMPASEHLEPPENRLESRRGRIVSDDPGVLLKIARLNACTGEWAAALDCLERASRRGASPGEVAAAASRVEAGAGGGTSSERARALVRLATSGEQVSSGELEAARELLV